MVKKQMPAYLKKIDLKGQMLSADNNRFMHSAWLNPKNLDLKL